MDTSSARNQARQWAAAYNRTNDHDLNYWVFVLERIRVAHRRPIDPALLGAIQFAVARVAENWNESLRYRGDQPTDDDLREVYDQVNWLLSQYPNIII
jgi:hypothetical protein